MKTDFLFSKPHEKLHNILLIRIRNCQFVTAIQADYAKTDIRPSFYGILFRLCRSQETQNSESNCFFRNEKKPYYLSCMGFPSNCPFIRRKVG